MTDIHTGCPHYVIMMNGYIHSIHGTLPKARRAICKSMKAWEIYEIRPYHSFEMIVSYKATGETPMSVSGD